MAAADGPARWLCGCCVGIAEYGGVDLRFVRWGLIGGGGQNRKFICSTVVGNRYLNRVLFGGDPTGN